MLIVFIRAILLYIFIIFSLRLMGKRQVGELQPSELVVTILVSNIATLPIEDTDIPMAMGFIPIITVVSLDVIMSNLTLKSKLLRKMVSGTPRIIIKDGQIDQQEMHRLRYSIDDLMESLHEFNIFDVSEVQFAIVETTGKINVYQKFSYQNATPQMLEIKGSDSNPPLVMISDGKLDEHNISLSKVGKGYIDMILRENKTKLKDVFLLTVDDDGKYNLIKKDKR